MTAIGMSLLFVIMVGMVFVFTLIIVGFLAGIFGIHISDADLGFISFCIAVVLTTVFMIYARIMDKDLTVKSNEIIIRYHRFNRQIIHKNTLKYIVNIYGHYYFYDHHDRLIGFISGYQTLAELMKQYGYPIVHEDPYEADYIRFRRPIVGFDGDFNRDLVKAYNDISFSQHGAARLNGKYFKRGYVVVLDDNMQINVMKK